MYWLIVGAVALGVGVAAFIWWAWWRLPKRQVKSLRLQIRDPKARADVEDNFRKTVGQALGVAAVLIGAGFAYLQFSQQQQASHELLISSQVGKGFEQLGSDKEVVRLGGIYALEGVMATSEQYYQPVLEALSAFVRDNTRNEKGDGPPATDIQAALTVIGRRGATGTGVPDLTFAHIPKAALSGANLRAAHLRDASLNGANLSRADLTHADLLDAHLSGASLRSAHLSSAILDGADLSNAGLSSTNLSYAHVVGANLSSANLSSANLISADLSGSKLNGADRSGANLNGSKLNRAKLNGAGLAFAKLNGADLSGADLNGAFLSFADLSGATVSETQLDQAACGDRVKLPPGLNLKPCNYPK